MRKQPPFPATDTLSARFSREVRWFMLLQWVMLPIGTLAVLALTLAVIVKNILGFIQRWVYFILDWAGELLELGFQVLAETVINLSLPRWDRQYGATARLRDMRHVLFHRTDMLTAQGSALAAQNSLFRAMAPILSAMETSASGKSWPRLLCYQSPRSASLVGYAVVDPVAGRVIVDITDTFAPMVDAGIMLAPTTPDVNYLPVWFTPSGKNWFRAIISQVNASTPQPQPEVTEPSTLGPVDVDSRQLALPGVLGS